MSNNLEGYSIKNELEKILTLFKENFKYILIIPALLGGIWQLFELSSISISYIRFFSVAQIVPDGLLILFIITIIYFSYKFTVFMMNLNKEKDDKGNFIESENKTSVLGKIFGLLLFSSGLAYLFHSEINPFSNRIVLSNIIISIPIIMILGSLILSILKELFIAIKKRFPKSWLKISTSFVFRSIFSFIVLYLFIFAIITFFNILSNFSNTYSLPKNLDNIKELKKSIKKDFPEFQNEIRYMNDKYVFIELTNNEKETKRLIFEFEKMFFIKENETLKNKIIRKCDTIEKNVQKHLNSIIPTKLNVE